MIPKIAGATAAIATTTTDQTDIQTTTTTSAETTMAQAIDGTIDQNALIVKNRAIGIKTDEIITTTTVTAAREATNVVEANHHASAVRVVTLNSDRVQNMVLPTEIVRITNQIEIPDRGATAIKKVILKVIELNTKNGEKDKATAA